MSSCDTPTPGMGTSHLPPPKSHKTTVFCDDKPDCAICQSLWLGTFELNPRRWYCQIILGGEEMVSAAAAIVFSALAQAGLKTAGRHLLNGPKDAELLLTMTIDTLAPEAVGGIQSWVGGILMPRTASRALEHLTVFDLAGVAWAEGVSMCNGDVLERAFGVPKRVVQNVLTAPWFVDVVTQAASDDLRFGVGQWDPSSGLPDKVRDGLVALLVDSASSELECEADATTRDFVRHALQETINGLTREFRGRAAVRSAVAHRLLLGVAEDGEENRRLLQETGRMLSDVLGHVEPRQLEDTIVPKLESYAATLLLMRAEDVFGRHARQAGEFGLLPLEKVYVEPDVEVDGGDRLPALNEIRKVVFGTVPKLAVLSAPFGFGKSLTIRTLAVELADDWLASSRKSREDHIPLLIHTPDVMTAGCPSLDAALQRHLTNTLDLTVSEAEYFVKHFCFTVLFDSYDEILQQTDDAKLWVTRICKGVTDFGGRVRILLAGRPYAFRDRWFDDQHVHLRVQSFTDDQVASWLAKTTGPVHSGLSPEAVLQGLDREIASTPILLLMAAWSWQEQTGAEQSPQGRTQLYETFITRIAEGKWKGYQANHEYISDAAEKVNIRLGEHGFREALAYLAWVHFEAQAVNTTPFRDEEQDIGLPLRVLSEKIHARFGAKLGQQYVDELVRSLVLSLFVRRGTGSKEIQFTHKSFREFLCAEHLMRLFRTSGPGVKAKAPRWMYALSVAGLNASVVNFFGDLARASEQDQMIDTVLREPSEERRDLIWKDRHIDWQESEEGTAFIWIGQARRRGDVLRGNAIALRFAVRDLEFDLDELGGGPHRFDSHGLELARFGNLVAFRSLNDGRLYARRTKAAEEVMLAVVDPAGNVGLESVPEGDLVEILKDWTASNILGGRHRWIGGPVFPGSIPTSEMISALLALHMAELSVSDGRVIIWRRNGDLVFGGLSRGTRSPMSIRFLIMEFILGAMSHYQVLWEDDRFESMRMLVVKHFVSGPSTLWWNSEAVSSFVVELTKLEGQDEGKLVGLEGEPATSDVR